MYKCHKIYILPYHFNEILFYLKIVYIYYLFSTVLGLSCCVGFSIVVASGGYSQFVVQGLLIAVASLVVEQGLQGAGASEVEAHGLSGFHSWALDYTLNSLAHRLSCSVAGRIFLDQGWNPWVLHWQAESLTLNHQGSPYWNTFYKQNTI